MGRGGSAAGHPLDRTGPPSARKSHRFLRVQEKTLELVNDPLRGYPRRVRLLESGRDARKGLTTMKYYAVCNVNGPISVELDGETVDEALASFGELDAREAIDNARTDIEEALDICGEGLSEDEMDGLLTGEGARPVRSLQQIVNGHSMREYHEADGWYLWAV